jgi:8-oxo-dGTP pyrophosphatase MutT (NUDIX family)
VFRKFGSVEWILIIFVSIDGIPMAAKHKIPADPVAAATVILTRQQAGELQVYLLRRAETSGFMAGNYVFPGGLLDPEDHNTSLWKDHVDLDADGLVNCLGGGLSATEALVYSIAAIRETFEEAGVFLAFKDDDNTQGLKKILKTRLAGSLPKGWLAKLVVSRGWILTLSALSRWSHWITPELMKRRFDTRFFVASLPAGQHCEPDGRETTHGIWISPEKGLAGNLTGEIPLSPPALITLHQFLQYSTLNDLENDTQNRQWGDALLPRLVHLDQGMVIVEPWDPQYARSDIQINSSDLKASLLPVGKPFSRIWHHNGLWRPVAT